LKETLVDGVDMARILSITVKKQMQ